MSTFSSAFYSQAYPPEMAAFMTSTFPFLIPIVMVIVIFSLILKGFALWHAARNSQKWWFIALLVLNTLGILELIYLVWFRPQTSQEEAPAVSSSREL